MRLSERLPHGNFLNCGSSERKEPLYGLVQVSSPARARLVEAPPQRCCTYSTRRVLLLHQTLIGTKKTRYQLNTRARNLHHPNSDRDEAKAS